MASSARKLHNTKSHTTTDSSTKSDHPTKELPGRTRHDLHAPDWRQFATVSTDTDRPNDNIIALSYKEKRY